MSGRRAFTGLAVTALLLTACAGGSEEVTDEGTSDATVQESEATEADPSPGEASEEQSGTQEVASVELIDVLVLSYLPGNTIISLGSQATGTDSCAIAVNAALDAGNSIELEIEGEDEPRSQRLEPSPTNGESLPCSVETLFVGVPADADSYTATQVGGSASGVYSTTVTAQQLKAAGNEIEVVERESGVSIEDILSTTCLSGANIGMKIYKDYSQFSGPGRGNDIWVESRVRLTNNCDKPIKAVTYKEVFTDVFGDTILSCEAKYTISIKVDKSKKTPKERGCLIDSFNSNFAAWDTASKADITTDVVVDQIVFADGSSIDSGL